uniref:C3H1-type domain-containing protein n=1 Tax=Meloidogyne incognita TaxID=6306 RepID=A0A914M929_MELIC
MRKSKIPKKILVNVSNHGNKAFFSCRGIRECVNYFTERGHTDILVFVPQFRREQSRSDSPIIDQHILNELEKEGKLIWTPSRRIGGRRIVCHDDRYILKTASEKQAVIVSNDEYRDLVKENPRWRSVVENYLLMYSFVDGKFMPPDDPLGRQGPNLDQLLTFGHSSINSQPCPYAKKCTYGNKCKYFHPERPNGVRIGAVDKLIGNNLNKKQYLTARPSLVAESVSSSSSSYLSPPPSHTNVGRTKSLNLTEMSKFNEEINLNPLSLQENTSTTTKEINQNQNNFSHMFAPSTSIWGSCEFSLSPKTTNLMKEEEINNNNLEKQRQHLQYHLSQLFPEATVLAVMAAHPQEMDAQILCQRIIAFQEGFQKEIEK